jgi:uncharacterized membrane protein HdeD (DUF308 family)
MDTGLLTVLALLTAAATLKAGSGGNPLPGYLLALLAGILALYVTQQGEVQSTVLLAWGVCGTGILSAYVGRQAEKARGT